MDLKCSVCSAVMYKNATQSQATYGNRTCDACERVLRHGLERLEKQREIANSFVYCPQCRTKYRRIDMPEPGECQGCEREKSRMAKLEARRKKPPMCTKCGDEEDADEDNFPGLCARCIDRKLDEEMEEDEAQDEIRIQKEAEALCHSCWIEIDEHDPKYPGLGFKCIKLRKKIDKIMLDANQRAGVQVFKTSDS